jgi:tRNA pseudouridine38-40 synthase
LNSSDSVEVANQRWRLDIAYDGTALHGFAEQPEQITVMGLLRDALALSLRLPERPEVVGAGRTDAGVHANAQVIHVDLPEVFYPNDRGDQVARLMKSLNNQLAGRVRIDSVQKVDETFHARFSATWRAYRYLVVEDSAPSLARNAAWAWAVKGPLDLDRMNEATKATIGTHDFRAFCKKPSDQEISEPLLRRVLEAEWQIVNDEMAFSPPNGRILRFDIRGESFCHQMVRSLVSSLVAIGQGELDVNEIAERLGSGSRSRLPAPASPSGLSLLGVGYPAFAGGASGFVS